MFFYFAVIGFNDFLPFYMQSKLCTQPLPSARGDQFTATASIIQFIRSVEPL